MGFILFILLYGDAPAYITTVRFNSLDACSVAMDTVKKEFPMTKAFCVSEGKK